MSGLKTQSHTHVAWRCRHQHYDTHGILQHDNIKPPNKQKVELKKKYLDDLAARASAKPLAAAPLKGPSATVHCMNASVPHPPNIPP